MPKLLEIISEIPGFDGLPEDHRRSVRDIAKELQFARGEMIFSDGDPGDGFYVVMEGRVKIFKLSPDGKEQILHIFGPGEPFGEVPVFSGKSFPANAEAIAPSRLLFFPRTDFIDLISKHPSIALNMLAVLSRRLRQFTMQIESLSLKEVPGRLAAYLMYLTEEQHASDAVTLTISKGQLASLLGTIPETLSRIFLKMTNDDLIRVDGRIIHLLDRGRIQELAEHGRLSDSSR